MPTEKRILISHMHVHKVDFFVLTSCQKLFVTSVIHVIQKISDCAAMQAVTKHARYTVRGQDVVVRRAEDKMGGENL